jgi:AMIN domain
LLKVVGVTMFNQEKKKGLGKSSLYLLPIAVCLASSAPAWSAPLKNWQYDPAANQLEVTVKDGVQPRYFLMAQPARIVLDLPNTEVGDVQTQQTFNGAVRQVRVSQFRPGLTRIILELSPEVSLARGQAQLQRVGDGEKATDRWVLRPLIAQGSPAPPQTTVQPPIPTPPTVAFPPGIYPSQVSIEPTNSNPLSETPSDRPTSDATPTDDKPVDIVVSRPSAPSAVSTSLPPTTVPVITSDSAPAPEDFPPGLAPATEQAAIASPPKQPAPIAQKPASLPLSEVNPSLAIPDSLPPVTVPNTPTGNPTVSVPPLNRSNLPATTANPAPSLPSATPVNPSATVTVPPLQPALTPSVNAATQPIRSTPTNTIEFGQPLPTRPVDPMLSYNPSVAGVMLPIGTVLDLRYPGTEALRLQSGEPRQEVLLLQTDLRDRAGNLIALEGTAVLGRFETNSSGSRFVAQAISLQGRNVAIAAQSETLGGTRKVLDNRLLRNSGIGAVAGAILGGLSGGNILGGAAAGAAITYATSPKPATIQPGQILQVRLLEDLR